MNKREQSQSADTWLTLTFLERLSLQVSPSYKDGSSGKCEHGVELPRSNCSVCTPCDECEQWGYSAARIGCPKHFPEAHARRRDYLDDRREEDGVIVRGPRS